MSRLENGNNHSEGNSEFIISRYFLHLFYGKPFHIYVPNISPFRLLCFSPILDVNWSFLEPYHIVIVYCTSLNLLSACYLWEYSFIPDLVFFSFYVILLVSYLPFCVPSFIISNRIIFGLLYFQFLPKESFVLFLWIFSFLQHFIY